MSNVVEDFISSHFPRVKSLDRNGINDSCDVCACVEPTVVALLFCVFCSDLWCQCFAMSSWGRKRSPSFLS